MFSLHLAYQYIYVYACIPATRLCGELCGGLGCGECGETKNVGLGVNCKMQSKIIGSLGQEPIADKFLAPCPSPDIQLRQKGPLFLVTLQAGWSFASSVLDNKSFPSPGNFADSNMNIWSNQSVRQKTMRQFSNVPLSHVMCCLPPYLKGEKKEIQDSAKFKPELYVHLIFANEKAGRIGTSRSF
jgi:hypothetical protein